MYPSYPNKSFGFPPPASQEMRKGEESDRDKDNLGWQWYDPPQNCLAVNFCNDTSLHGLHYVGQPKRHICERIFWAASVLASIGVASYLIWQMVDLNKKMPIITVFNAEEKSIAEIPFPAVTVCNVNNIRKSKFNAAVGRGVAALSPFTSKEDRLDAFATLLDMFHICESSSTFIDRFVDNSTDLWSTIGKLVTDEMFKTKHEYEDLVNPVVTLAENSQPCKEMILFCIWQDEIKNCSRYFQEIETDYGYCCTFNTIPVSLLHKFRNDPRDSPKKVREWGRENLNYDNLLNTKETKNRKYPQRQKYPGREAGLSILLDPDLEEYHCTNTDSTGYVVALNVPLDFPRIKDNGIAVRTGSEVLINVRPEVIMSDDSVKSFSVEQRQCYFGAEGENQLPHYSKYTTSNCMDECIARRTMEECKCVRYYMPRGDPESGGNICRPPQYECTKRVRKEIIQEGLAEACSLCLPTCTEIQYHSETTSLPIIEEHVRRLANNSLHEFFKSKHKLKQASIVHIYFGVDSTNPRLRKENYSINELISNAGGILGLCLGFSALSVLEIIYYVSIRLGCNWYRKRLVSEKEGQVHPLVLSYDSNVMKLQQKAGNGRWMPTPVEKSELFQPNFSQRGYSDQAAFSTRYHQFA